MLLGCLDTDDAWSSFDAKLLISLYNQGLEKHCSGTNLAPLIELMEKSRQVMDLRNLNTREKADAEVLKVLLALGE